MKRIIIILAAVAVIAVGAFFVLGNDAPNSTAIEPMAGAANAQSTDPDVAEAASNIPEMFLGNPDADVTVVEYASFTCPHCATFHKGPFKELKADYIDTGKIKFVYREVYFDRYGLWASMVARCGTGEKFFGIADLIYSGQSEWVRAGEPAAIADELRKIGRLAGLDKDTLDACLQDANQAQALATWWEGNSAKDEITSTPSFIIDGKKHSNMPYAEMKDLIDAALAD